MKKLALIAFAAMMILTACTKDDTKWINGTLWEYSHQTDENFKKECYVSFRNGSGEVSYYYGFPPSYGYAYTDLCYHIKSYTFDGTQGTIELQGIKYHAHDCTATFTLNYDQKKMSISCPDFSCTLERIK